MLCMLSESRGTEAGAALQIYKEKFPDLYDLLENSSTPSLNEYDSAPHFTICISQACLQDRVDLRFPHQMG